jgi:hypothetical protein
MPTTSAQRARVAMQVKLHTPEGKAAYARRKVIVEPVFGRIKSVMGFRRFSLRGLMKAPSEWGIVCACDGGQDCHARPRRPTIFHPLARSQVRGGA